MSVEPSERLLLSQRDPYSLLVDALWQVLEASADFCALVRPGNRIKFTGKDRDPIKEKVAEGDLPEVRIVAVSSLPGHPSSNSYSDTVTFEVQVSSGDQRLDAHHLPMKFVIYKALSNADKYLLGSVVWENQQVAKRATPVTVREGVTETDLNRGVVGWAALWAIEVELWFQRSSL